MSCFTQYCLGTPDGNRQYCPKCRKRKQRAKNKLLTTYMNLKHRAKQRGIGFKLSLKEFKEFCDTTGYLEKKGTDADSMTIDRIKAWKGYEVGNIQMMTLVDNVRKGHKEPKTDPAKEDWRTSGAPF